MGRAHGYDGSFYVEEAEHPLAEGDEVSVGGRSRRVERRAGTDERPLVRLSAVEDREAAIALQGERLLVPETAVPLEEGEWLAEDLVGLRAEGGGSAKSSACSTGRRARCSSSTTARSCRSPRTPCAESTAGAA